MDCKPASTIRCLYISYTVNELKPLAEIVEQSLKSFTTRSSKHFFFCRQEKDQTSQRQSPRQENSNLIRLQETEMHYTMYFDISEEP